MLVRILKIEQKLDSLLDNAQRTNKNDQSRIEYLQTVTELFTQYTQVVEANDAKAIQRVHGFARSRRQALVRMVKACLDDMDRVDESTCEPMANMLNATLDAAPEANLQINVRPHHHDDIDSSEVLALLSECSKNILDRTLDPEAHPLIPETVAKHSIENSLNFLDLFEHACEKRALCTCFTSAGHVPKMVEIVALDLGSQYARPLLQRQMQRISKMYRHTSVSVALVKALKRLYPYVEAKAMINERFDSYINFVKCKHYWDKDLASPICFGLEFVVKSEADSVFSTLLQLEHKIKRDAIPYVLTLLLKIAMQEPRKFAKQFTFLRSLEHIYVNLHPVSGRIALQILAVLSADEIYPRFDQTVGVFRLYETARDMNFAENELLNVTYMYVNLIMFSLQYAPRLVAIQAEFFDEHQEAKWMEDFQSLARAGVLRSWLDMITVKPITFQLLQRHRKMLEKLQKDKIHGSMARKIVREMDALQNPKKKPFSAKKAKDRRKSQIYEVEDGFDKKNERRMQSAGKMPYKTKVDLIWDETDEIGFTIDGQMDNGVGGIARKLRTKMGSADSHSSKSCVIL